MASHLQNFAHHLIGRHGPRKVGHIWAGFVNAGNSVPGDSTADQHKAVAAELAADDRLVTDSETGVVSYKPDDAA